MKLKPTSGSANPPDQLSTRSTIASNHFQIPAPRYRVANNTDQNLRRYSFPENVVELNNLRPPRAVGETIGPLTPHQGILGQVNPNGTLTYHVNTAAEGNHLSGHALIHSLLHQVGQQNSCRTKRNF